MGGQDDRLGQFDAAIGAVDADGFMECGPVRADLEAEIVVAEQPDEGAGREAGFEGKGGVIPGRSLVDRRLDARARVV